MANHDIPVGAGCISESREDPPDFAPSVLLVHGARVHNLENITVAIPRNKLVVITGFSGSGKSSLAFDTIYAEGQRRYMASLSAYARQFLEQLDKPHVDAIDGLSPTIEQRAIARNPRSAVGTVTDWAPKVGTAVVGWWLPDSRKPSPRSTAPIRYGSSGRCWRGEPSIARGDDGAQG